MILKELSRKSTISPTAKTGQAQEENVAFFLRRAFKDSPHVFVINDFKFTHNGETAQIDHLIVYSYGFILMESKSITGEVKVNSFSEWTRSFNGKWSGMPSPIKQVELQQILFRELLFVNSHKILPKILGLKQQYFGFRCWDNICVVSSNAIIDRETMPDDVSQQLVKSEFLVDKIHKVMNLKSAMGRLLSLTDSRPKFSDFELTSITAFLMAQTSVKVKPEPQASMQPQVKQQEEKPAVIEEVAQQYVAPIVKITPRLTCKKCGESSDYQALGGRYGYYIKCNKCTTNTTMKLDCISCDSKNTKVSKSGEVYSLVCADCGSSERLL